MNVRMKKVDEPEFIDFSESIVIFDFQQIQLVLYLEMCLFPESHCCLVAYVRVQDRSQSALLDRINCKGTHLIAVALSSFVSQNCDRLYRLIVLCAAADNGIRYQSVILDITVHFKLQIFLYLAVELILPAEFIHKGCVEILYKLYMLAVVFVNEDNAAFVILDRILIIICENRN